MPHNACTVLLNGHGSYNPHKIINMMSCPFDYNLVFPCLLGETLSVSHHNLILSDLATCPKDQINNRLQVIELPNTTSIINKTGSLDFATDMIYAHRSSLFFEHTLTNAPEVLRAHTLVHTNGTDGLYGNRFHSSNLNIIKDATETINWGDCNLQVEFDIEDARDNVLKNFSTEKSVLSSSQLLSIKPIALNDKKATFLLSDLLINAIPKIKIFASKHKDGTIDVLPQVFLDLRESFSENYSDLKSTFPIFQNPDDQLHELQIGGEANIIWDACRFIC